MEKIVIELIKYGSSSNNRHERKTAFRLAKIIEISTKEKFKDILDIVKIILSTYADRNLEGEFYLKPIPETIHKKISELEKNTLKRRNKNLIKKIDNIKE